MDNSKKSAFVKRMGKKRLSLAKGGMIKRKHYDLGGLTGMAGGAGGTGFSIAPGTNGQQLNDAYKNSQLGLVNQNILTGQLIPQTTNAVASQNTLAGQYANQAAGIGPNVATNVLNQATGANVANQASIAAGQRGASSNPGLIARQTAQTGAGIQQTAAGQAATTQAQQQIAAEQAAAQLAANQITQSQGAVTAENTAGQGEQGILQGANTAANNVQGQLANTNLQGQQGLIGGVLNGVGSIFDEGGEVSANPAAHKKLEFVHKMTKLGLDHHDKTPMMMAGGGDITNNGTSWLDRLGTVKAGAPQAQASDSPPPINPSAGQSVSNSFNSMGAHFAEGGLTVPQVNVQTPQAQYAPVQQVQGGFAPTQNAGADALSKSTQKLLFDPNKPKPMAEMNAGIPAAAQSVLGVNPQVMGPMGSTDQSTLGMNMAAHGGEMHPHFMGPHKSHVANYLMNKGGPVPALVSAGEIYLSPEQVHEVIHNDVDPAKIGHKFKGKAKIKGDSLKNDNIPATLETGGVVVDRDNMGSAEKRKLFVHRSVAKAKAGRM